MRKKQLLLFQEKELGKTLINAASSNTDAEAESYFDNTIEAKYTAEPLKTTMTQKYFALWGASGEATESYNDVRRMKGLGENFIELKNPNSFPLRCPYGNSDHNNECRSESSIRKRTICV